MRFFVTFMAVFAASVAVAADVSTQSAEPASVLKREAVVVTEEPVAVPTPATPCESGNCGTRMYSTQTETRTSCRNRLFGGYVVRDNTRVVVRPVRGWAGRRCTSGRCGN